MNPIDHYNIKNMTTLWRSYGAEEKSLRNGKIVFNCSWPNKIWVEGILIDSEFNMIDKLVYELQARFIDRVFTTWDRKIECLVSSFKIQYEYSNSLIGMSLDLDYCVDNLGSTNHTGLISHLLTEQDIDFWCNLCSKGFEYFIDPKAIYSAIRHPQNKIYWYSVDGIPVGTAVTSESAQVMGFHQISVIPEWRGKGIASGIIRHLINRAKHSSASAAVLQASPMGLGVYKKFGFTEDFELKSFRLTG